MASRLSAALLGAFSFLWASVLNPNISSGKTPKTTKATKAKTPIASKTTVASARTTAISATSRSWHVLRVTSSGLKEVSGCAVSRLDPNRVWLHNDAGDGAIVLPVDIRSGAVGRPVTLKGVDVVDPEDIAITTDGDLILADVGDNAVARTSVQLYRFAEPRPGAKSAEATRFDLQYPDGPHNAEALAVSADAKAAYIFTKDPSGIAAVFRVDLTRTTTQKLAHVGTVTIAGEAGYKANLISAADAVGGTLLLRTFQFGYLLAAPRGGSLGDALHVAPRRFTLPEMPQGEALCISANGRTLVTASESQGDATFDLAVGPTPQ